ncbi:hypothetical protein HDU92_007763 [Lobulomyces angularis]|nr:hypothetical protein HDU92_007763 [Lobulomyces angularis]
MKVKEPNIVLGKNAKVPTKRINSNNKYEVYSSSPRIVYIMPNSKTNVYVNIKANIANTVCDEIIIKDNYDIEYISDLIIGKICKNAFEYIYIKVFNFSDYGYAVKPGDKIALIELDPSSVENVQNIKCYNY